MLSRDDYIYVLEVTFGDLAAESASFFTFLNSEEYFF